MNSIIYMDAVLYEAAAAGDIGPFEKYLTCLDRLLTTEQRTILHVYLRNQLRKPESTDFVDKILERCPPLLLQANKKGETPLHLAAKFGHSNVVKLLIDRAKAQHADSESGVTAAKMMLRMTNGEGDTALHEAARNARSHVVEILTKEDPDFSYSANVHGETPLYIAASIGYLRRLEKDKVIDEILRNCISVDYGGPNGRTTLHAATTAGDHVTARKILEKEKKLTKATDVNGWSPLHYAAYFCHWIVVKELLECDVTATYIAETEKKRTALHIAAIQGHVSVMKEIVLRCPACCSLVDNRGWNALHYVVASGRYYAFKACLKMIPELERLKTEKDDKGNTPFHLIAALTHKDHRWCEVCYDKESGIYGFNKQELSIANIRFGDFGEIQKEIVESLEDVGSGPFGYGPSLFRIDELEEIKRKEEEALNKIRESHLVVAALIATVTFAAAFTLPGGYKSDDGTAMLAKKAAFIVFVISDAISMVLSISAVFIHFLLVLYQASFSGTIQSYKTYQTIGNLFGLATWFTMIGMGTMIIAFIAGTYAVLEPVLGLAINICLLGTTRKILEKERKLTKTTDENDWTPLHYAAYFSSWIDISAVKALLECDAFVAYIAEKEKKRTALHIAAIQGHVDVMKEIVYCCPACCDLVDNRGWNALHYAVASKDSQAFKKCLRIPELERLKTEKDDKGNTPFHLIAALTHKQEEWNGVYPHRESGIYGLNKQEQSIANIRSGDFGEIQKKIVESLKDVGSGPFGYGPFLIIRKHEENEEIERNMKEVLNKTRESHLVVAALIATITFAATFTLPGGYKSDHGTAILAKKAAFIVFLISNAISMVLSISAVFIHFLLAFNQASLVTTFKLFALATLFTMIGMRTMIIAFITGTYAVLEPVLGLAVSICLIGLSFFFLACGIIYKDLRHYI